MNVRKMLNIILFILFCSILGFFKVSASANPYKATGPYGTNCTWYAWKMANEKVGVSLPGLGDAKNWYNNAKNKGYSVGDVPKANSIVVWGEWTSYGHVGYVEKVEGNTIYVWDSASYCIDEEDTEYKECMVNSVCEETDRACKQKAKQISCKYNLLESYYTVTGYIYLNEVPKEPIASDKSENNTIKKEKISKSEEKNKSSNSYLSDLTISVGNIDFNKDTYEYNVEVENDIDKIVISAVLEDKKASLEGTGEYELNVGLNEIKILVTAEDKSIKEYVIKILKTEKAVIEQEIDTSSIEDDNIEKDNKNCHLILVVLSGCLLIVLLFILIGYFKRKN